jgi:hypothetical protein
MPLRLGQITIVKNTTGANGTFDFTVSGTSAASPKRHHVERQREHDDHRSAGHVHPQ